MNDRYPLDEPPNGVADPERLHAALSDGTVLRDLTWRELRDGGYPVPGPSLPVTGNA